MEVATEESMDEGSFRSRSPLLEEKLTQVHSVVVPCCVLLRLYGMQKEKEGSYPFKASFTIPQQHELKCRREACSSVWRFPPQSGSRRDVSGTVCRMTSAHTLLPGAGNKGVCHFSYNTTINKTTRSLSSFPCKLVSSCMKEYPTY